MVELVFVVFEFCICVEYFVEGVLDDGDVFVNGKFFIDLLL